MRELWEVIRLALGLGADSLNIWQMTARAVIVYIAALALVRIGEKRFLSKSTAFDVILGIILGSVLSRAITGTSPFFETLAVGLVLVEMHWTMAVIAFRSDRFGTLVKGSTQTLIRDGEIQWDAMRSGHISEDDLRSSLRFSAKLDDPSKVKQARLERSGEISVIPREGKPRIVEVKVEDGVQTIRIELS